MLFRSAAPTASSPFDQCGWTDLEISFPEAYLVPGQVPPEQTTIYEQQSAEGPDCGSSAAETGGGNLLNVDLDIQSADATSVVLTTTVTLRVIQPVYTDPPDEVRHGARARADVGGEGRCFPYPLIPHFL